MHVHKILPRVCMGVCHCDLVAAASESMNTVQTRIEAVETMTVHCCCYSDKEEKKRQTDWYSSHTCWQSSCSTQGYCLSACVCLSVYVYTWYSYICGHFFWKNSSGSEDTGVESLWKEFYKLTDGWHNGLFSQYWQTAVLLVTTACDEGSQT